jgi:hypothetical protein
MSRTDPPPEVHDLAVLLWHLMQVAAADAAEDAAKRRDPTPSRADEGPQPGAKAP